MGRSYHSGRRQRPLRRRLRVESLEERRLLSITVNTLTDELDANIADGDISLRDALLAATPYETITFDPALFASGPATLTLTLGELRITKDVSIVGPADNSLTIDASGNDLTPGVLDGRGSRIFNINNAGPAYNDVQLRNLTLVGGDASGDGGAIRNLENLTLSNLFVFSNSSRGSGGGIHNSGALTMISSIVSGNTAVDFGGGIDSSGPYLTILDSTFYSNSATNGAGIAAHGQATDWTMTNAVIHNNSGERGGGVYTTAPITRFNNNSFLFNFASVEGGGIYASGSTIQFNGGLLQSNNTGGRGGGIFASGGDVSIEAATVEANTAADRGGGVYVANGNVNVNASSIYFNSANSSGGGLYVNDGGLAILSSTISGNFAGSSGGGIRANVGLHSATVAFSTITQNYSTLGGGVAVDLDSQLFLDGTILAGNAIGNQSAPDLFGHASARYSLIGINAGASINHVGPNIVGTLAAPVDPVLLPLNANGGPTLTHALGAGSPAIDAGDPFAFPGNNVPLFDQRGVGFDRVLNGDAVSTPRIDIGAFETKSGVLRGQVWDDLNANGIKDGSEPGIPNWTVYLDGNSNGVLDSLGESLDPDDFGTGSPLDNVVPGVTLSYANSPGSSVFANFGFASTGSLSFGLFDSFYRLRADFATPTDTVSIDAIGYDGFDRGRLEAYDINGFFLAAYETAGLAQGQFETMTISRPQADVAFVLVGGGSFEIAGLDNLQFGLSERSTVTDADGFYEFEVAPGTHTIGQVVPSGWEGTYPPAVSSTLAQITANSASIAALVPTRFNFFDGDFGFYIDDGGNDMYDGGNFLSTELWNGIPYTAGTVSDGTPFFGPGSQYFTAKYPGLWVMGAAGTSVNNFNISGGVGADFQGTVNGEILSTTVNGRQFTIYVKRIGNTIDPSVNHIIMIPGNGSGVTRTFPNSTDEDTHVLNGLAAAGVNQIYYALVARSNGALLASADALNIANAILGSVTSGSGSHTVFVNPGDEVTNLNFGNHALPGSIAGKKWSDLNGNSLLDPGEPGLPGWTIFLDENGDGVVQAPTITTVQSTDIPRLIVPVAGQPAKSVLTASNVGLINDINVTLRINHTWDEDLDVFLISPSGTRVELFTDVGGSADNFFNTTLDDEAATPITGGTAPFAGTFRPEGHLSDFDGEVGDGVWTLELGDDFTGADTGTLVSWSLTFDSGGERLTVTDANGDYVFENLPRGSYVVTEVNQVGWERTAPQPLSSTFAELKANAAAISALIPDRFDFFEGETGSSIIDGGNDMYDGGNILNTNLATAIPYTNNVIVDGSARFGPGSKYFTAKYPGLFVLAAADISITTFRIAGDNGADGGGIASAESFTTTVNGQLYTAFLKRVYFAGDPSINHLIMIPGDGAGVAQTIDFNTNLDTHVVTGLAGVGEIYYALVSRSAGQFLETADAMNIANAVLGTVRSVTAAGGVVATVGPGQDVTSVNFGNQFVGATGDYDGDTNPTGNDFLLWQLQVGGPRAAGTGADGNGSGYVDLDDLPIWKTKFIAATSATQSASAAAAPAALDAVFAAGDFTTLFRSDFSAAPRPRWRTARR